MRIFIPQHTKYMYVKGYIDSFYHVVRLSILDLVCFLVIPSVCQPYVKVLD